ncbi:MAG TPA: C25 family cysteine peptidase [Candidatus Cloacimonadota bacterium]|nr:C25 family cysteine peptidase [Candidatus Cloacimonadota bacterium]
MKKNLFFILILLTAFTLSAEWIEVNRDSEMFEHISYGIETTEVSFSLPGYELETVNEDGVEYQKISYSNEGEIMEVGKPALPCFSRLLAIPNQGITTVRILDYEEDTISNISVYPQQELQVENQPSRGIFTIDESFYNNGTIFPMQIIETGTPAIMRGVRVVKLTINPFRYDPVSHELKIITNIDVMVNTEGSGGENTITRSERKKSRAFEPLFQSNILNYASSGSREDDFQDPSYLFICPNNTDLLTNLQYLVNWKHQMGYDVTVATTSQTGTSTTTIKAYIQNAYDNWENPPEFVCFVGDANGAISIPTYFESYSYYNGEGDHPYAELEGGDILEDVFLGRISVETVSQLQVYVTKILNYERQPYMSETDWYNKAVLVGDPSHSGPSTVFVNQFIDELMQEYAPNIVSTGVYTSGWANGISSNLNAGDIYMNYRGYVGMSNFYTSNIYALTNYKKFPFAVFLTCGTGSFASEESRSEAFIRVGSVSNPVGAIAAIGTATTGTHTQFNNCICAGIYYGLFADAIHNPGGAVNRGKLSLYLNYPTNPSNAVNIFTHWNTLIGDPGVHLWTSIPQEMNVTYNDEISPGTDYLEVMVQDSNGEPLENAWVTATMGDDDIFATGYTDAAGYIALPVFAELQGTANLIVTKHDFIPHLGGFDVVEMEKYVNILDYLIDDDNNGTSSGNSDGNVNPGENIELQVELKNFGTQTANSVTATISSDNDFTITDAEETYGNIAANSSLFSSDDFDFSVDASTLGSSEIKLDMVIEDDLGNTWNDIIYLIVEGATLDEQEYTILDNGNGFLDPGEITEMSVTLQNLGSLSASAVYGELTSNNEQVVVTDNLGYFGDISANGQAANSTDTFGLSAGTQLVVGTQVAMDLHLYNADGYDDTVQFIMSVGEVQVTDPLGPDAYSYFCYDDDDEGYFNVPAYDWIEINTIGTQLPINDAGDTGSIADINNLPIAFSMYGIQYDMLTVCSNGWIAPGGASQASFMNTRIPGPQGPMPMIAPFWDDLRNGSQGHVYWYYDAELHYVVIEWYHMQNDYSSSEETFQVILYDFNYYPTFTGDSEIKFQYKVVNNNDSGSSLNEHGQYSTVGIEDHTSRVGLEYTYNNTYPDAAKPLENQMALLFTTSSQYWGFAGGTVTLNGGNAEVENVIISNGTTNTHPDQAGNFVYPLLPGTYELTASLAGYMDDVVTDIVIVEEQTTPVDFTLTALPIPANFEANLVDYNDVVLTWESPETQQTGRESRRNTAHNSRDLNGYRLYRNGNLLAEITDPAIFTYSDMTLSAGTYEYWITAVHDLGESLPSTYGVISVTFPTPENPEATTSGADILFSWDAPSRELLSYKVYRNLVMIAEDITETTYLDLDMPNGTYSYNVRAVYSGGYMSVLSADAVIEHVQMANGNNPIPVVTSLNGNYPNPFNPETTISFSTTESSAHTEICIYNLKGQKVKQLVDAQFSAGQHSVVWYGKDDNGKPVSSGIYLCKMKAGNYQNTRKMILLR